MNEPINERLQELLEMFLHRSCSPAEENELFETCLHDPHAAETVRQQLILSLKIRKLRDETEVPLEVRNALFRRINTLPAEAPAQSERRPVFAWIGELRLGWSHVVAAGVAAVLAVFIATNSGTDTALPLPEQIVSTVVDTVHLHTVDTLREVERVRVPVYIEKNIAASDRASERTQADETHAAPGASPGDTRLAQQTPDSEKTAPATGIAVTRDMQVTRSNFREQYSDMVANTDKIQLTDDDRVRL